MEIRKEWGKKERRKKKRKERFKRSQERRKENWVRKIGSKEGWK